MANWPEEIRRICAPVGFYDPKRIARDYVENIESGIYSTSYGKIGNILGYAANGTSQESSIFRVLIQVSRFPCQQIYSTAANEVLLLFELSTSFFEALKPLFCSS